VLQEKKRQEKRKETDRQDAGHRHNLAPTVRWLARRVQVIAKKSGLPLREGKKKKAHEKERQKEEDTITLVACIWNDRERR
jgi:hypothetical protein